MMGDISRWVTVKDLLAAGGKWEAERRPLLAQLKASRPYHECMGILSHEKELTLLMAEVRAHPDTVFRYGSQLCGLYREEVCTLCKDVILKEAKIAFDRGMYRKGCGLLEALAGLGGMEEAAALMQTLRTAYPHRPAMLDELDKLEQRIAKKKDGASKETDVLKLKV